jgi:hypothetical protein
MNGIDKLNAVGRQFDDEYLQTPPISIRYYRHGFWIKFEPSIYRWPAFKKPPQNSRADMLCAVEKVWGTGGLPKISSYNRRT